MLASTGTLRLRRSKSSSEMSCFARRACAMTWMIALVEQPSAIATVMPFRKASRVWMLEGRRSSWTISTMRRPTCVAMRWWLASTAGMEEAPGSVMPMASAIEVIVLAVPIVMQVPELRAMPPMIDCHWPSVIVPARRSSQYLNASEPEPSVWPRDMPRNIGPAGRKIAGTSALVAPSSIAGVVLSQPPISTTPSTG